MKLDFLIFFFKNLNKNNVNYCHWKSNYFLDKSFRGDSDLDIYIDRLDVEKFISIALNSGFKHVIPEKHKMYIGIDNFIGFDEKGGKTIHLHLYFKLITGKHLLKDFYLPFENFYLENTTIHSKFHIKIPSVENELIVLICRILIKLRFVKNIFNINIFKKDLIDEINYLLKNTDVNLLNKSLLNISNLNINEEILNFIKFYKNKKLSRLKLLILSFILKKKLIIYTRYNVFQKFYIYIFRKFLTLLSKNDRNKRRMILNKSGLIFAFVGVPGSGKSSTSNLIKIWLNQFMGVKKYYFGIPQKRLYERITLFIFIPANLFFKIIKKLNKKNLIYKLYSYIYDLSLCLRWYGVAKSVYKTYKLAKRDAFNGQVVILDRYSVNEINNVMKSEPVEAPRIESMAINNKWVIVKLFIRKEKNIYDILALDSKIILLWLDVDTEISVKRGRNELGVSFQNSYFKKIETNGINRIRIDANLSHDVVLNNVKKIIWEKI